MAKYILCISVYLLFRISCVAQSYGLIFNSHEVVLEKRTALDLSPGDSICLAKNFELSFDLSFLRNYQVYFGYVFRIVSNNNENIDLIYNQPTSSFQIIVGENFSGISFSIDSMRLYKDWSRINLKCDLENHTLQCIVNNRVIGKRKLAVSGNCFKFLWGANDFQKFKTRDLPPMQIKDIRISEMDKLRYFWPLDETSGTQCRDRNGNHAANVKNPTWVKNQHQNWESLASFSINGYAGVGFDSRLDNIYISGSDSLGVYTLKNEKRLEWIAGAHQNLLLGHQNIYDTLNRKLWDSYPDEKKLVPYDFGGRRWGFIFPSDSVRITEFWHANKFISLTDTSLYTIAGYGYLRYKNLVQRYSLATKKWDLLTPSGDYFTPRYLSALGTSPSGEYAYILGGYGSQTGDQMLDPKYYYDLFRYDVKRNSFKRVCNFKPVNTAFTFANSLVFDSTDYYGLVFSNDSYNSSLQLVRGSLNDSILQQSGGPIPYKFHDIQSFADLYYSPVSNKLIAVTLFYTPLEAKEKRTEVNIYSLNFPPESLDTSSAETTGTAGTSWLLWLISGIIAIALLLAYILIKKRTKVKLSPEKTSPTREDLPTFITPAALPAYTENPPESAICLFGQFQVYDKDGNDITRLFTPLLKELFLVISIYSIRNGRGISSEGLNEILWHNKSDKDAKNNRSVNIVKLKGILEKVGNCTINKKSGYWQFETADNAIYIDYRNYMMLVHTFEQDKNYSPLLLDIVKRGAFLMQTEYNWLDDIKSEISNFVINACLGLIKSQHISKDPESIIEIAGYIFHFDKLNEDALTYKCKSLILLKRHTLANNAYQKFIHEYKNIYGEDFGKSFHDIIS